MKKSIISIVLVGFAIMTSACNSQETTENCAEEIVSNVQEISETQEVKEEQEMSDAQKSETKTTISGSFTVCVRDVIPDYCMDDVTKNVAVVTEFQSNPFTLFVGEEIANQLEIGKNYVFTINPIEVDKAKENLEGMSLASLVWELTEFEITEFRLANEDELGLESLTLTIE